MKTIATRISDEEYYWIERYCEGNTLSEKLRWYISSHLNRKEVMKEKIAELENRLNLLKESLDNNLFDTLYSIPEDVKSFLSESKTLIKDNPKLLIGRCNLFNNEFNKKISVNEFEHLLKEANDGVE